MSDVLVKTSQALPVTSTLTALLQALAAQALALAKLQPCSLVCYSCVWLFATTFDPCTCGKHYAGSHCLRCSHLLHICLSMADMQVHSLQLHKLFSRLVWHHQFNCLSFAPFGPMKWPGVDCWYSVAAWCSCTDQGHMTRTCCSLPSRLGYHFDASQETASHVRDA